MTSWPTDFGRQAALEAMLEKARELGLTRGVAVVCAVSYHPNSKTFPRIDFAVLDGKLQRDPRPPKNIWQRLLWFFCPWLKDRGTNYLGVALMKLAWMVATDTISGNTIRHLKTGEIHFPGGLILIEDTMRIFTAFSGGTGEQDTEIARAGMSQLT